MYGMERDDRCFADRKMPGRMERPWRRESVAKYVTDLGKRECEGRCKRGLERSAVRSGQEE